MNFPLETAQRIMADLSSPIYNNGDLNRRYKKAAEDLVSVIFTMSKDIDDLKIRMRVLEVKEETRD